MPLDTAQRAALQSQLTSIFSISTANKYTQEIQLFLRELSHLVAEDQDNVFSLLRQQSEDGWSIGHIIARYHSDPEVVEAYLTLLKDLIAKDLPTAIQLLQQQTAAGFNIGHMIARYHMDPTVVPAYLTLLQDLMTKDLSAAIWLLQLQTKNGCNIGRIIARNQTDPTVLRAYLTLLQALMAKDLSAAIELLQQQNQDRWNLGHFIVRLKSTEVINHYFDLLNEIAPLATTAISSLLPQTIEAYIKHSAKVTELLVRLPSNMETLTLLRQCLDNTTLIGKYCHTSTGFGLKAAYRGETTMVTTLSARLKEVIADMEKKSVPTGKGIEPAMPLDTAQRAALQSKLKQLFSIHTTNKYAKEISQFLNELSSLVAEHQNDVFSLLRQQLEDGWSIGRIIARYQTNPTVVRAYLTLLQDLMAKDLPAAIQLLQQQTAAGFNIGHLIARYQMDPTVVPAYLTLLKDLMTKDLSAAIKLLQQQTTTGFNIGHLIARNQMDPTVVPAYLTLLKDLMTKDLSAAIRLLQQRNENNCNIGPIIAHNQTNPTVVRAYLTLLQDLMDKDLSAAIDLLQQQNRNRWNLGHFIVRLKSTEVIDHYFDLLNEIAQRATTAISSLLPQTIEAYIKHSAKVTALLVRLPPNMETLTLLRQCLDNTTPIGKYCHTSTGFGLKAAYRGETTMLTTLSARLEEVIADMEKKSAPAGQSIEYADSSMGGKTVRGAAPHMLELKVIRKDLAG